MALARLGRKAGLEGVSPFDFAEVPVSDGVSHPSDGGSGGRVGLLKFSAAE